MSYTEYERFFHFSSPKKYPHPKHVYVIYYYGNVLCRLSPLFSPSPTGKRGGVLLLIQRGDRGSMNTPQA